MRHKKGQVVSTKQQKTLVVKVDSYKTHPKYKKRFKVSKKFHVDNPENKPFELGDTIEIFETRPLSKLKRWTIVKPEQSQAEQPSQPQQ
ncbi:30S ribosomal protein S17 [Candidatus Peregrinibacteria bacterium CG_4_10_14_0_2_um_filter_38_24]|nr:MAG: 30S ribosomal protein S17 [Candidatus Peregrinibacteria bacterium CG_4_10_14_0_2_um_filter_38_24]PJC38618.1 MAG: 30S ribosomal protein S17 [Candidatus Peregrinibacteria bacterium CG_4_9_14_0_2_um_filter_38_9]